MIKTFKAAYSKIRTQILTPLLIVVCQISFGQTDFNEIVTTNHIQKINNKELSYTATTGFLPYVKNERDTVINIHFTYYQSNHEKAENRPLLISFNGGPGSASVWMHLAYTGPYKLNIDDEGFPIQPYGYSENPYSVLDVTDILYVNPVNTGYSRFANDKVPEKDYYGIYEDITYLSEWLNMFLTKFKRWKSPKYLIGESYGTTRVAGIVNQMQNAHWAYFNGVILVSPTELGIERNGPVKIANRIPYYTAVAWFHKKLKPEYLNKNLDEVLELSEKFAINELLPALTLGGSLSKVQLQNIASKMASLTGLKESYVTDSYLDVPTFEFWKELLRDDGFAIGRLDSRYKGLEESKIGESPSYYSAITSWLHAFAPAVNSYFDEKLKFNPGIKYNVFGSVQPWNRDNENTGLDLRTALAQNPFLNVMIQSGYYDGATNYFDAKYTMNQINRSDKFTDRINFITYKSGHMMYLRHEDLIKANQDIRDFILKSKSTGAAKY